jgi:hypothetical protein
MRQKVVSEHNFERGRLELIDDATELANAG